MVPPLLNPDRQRDPQAFLDHLLQLLDLKVAIPDILVHQDIKVMLGQEDQAILDLVDPLDILVILVLVVRQVILVQVYLPDILGTTVDLLQDTQVDLQVTQVDHQDTQAHLLDTRVDHKDPQVDLKDT